MIVGVGQQAKVTTAAVPLSAVTAAAVPLSRTS
jgi:hypothetical protein